MQQPPKLIALALGLLLLVTPLGTWCADVVPTHTSKLSERAPGRYYDELDRLLPGWKKVNTDPSFLKWLDGKAKQGAGWRRQQLNSAFDAKDALASARIFERWADEVDLPLPTMRREDLLWIGAVTFDDACRGCHTFVEATERIRHYTELKQKAMGKQIIPSPISMTASLFFQERPDKTHNLPSRANFEIAGLVTLLTENAFGSKVPEVPPGSIAAERAVSRLAQVPSRLDPGIGTPTTPTKPKSTAAARREWRSEQFGYAITVPAGWYQIPATELAKYMARLPAQVVQRVTWEAAFQRDNSGTWFDRPYFFVQVTTPASTHLHKLPTAEQFRAVTDSANMHRATVSPRLQEAINATPDPADRVTAQAAKESLAGLQVESDLPNREYWFSDNVQVDGDIVKMFSLCKFLPTGFLIQISSYVDAATAPNVLPLFREVGHSIRATTSSPSP